MAFIPAVNTAQVNMNYRYLASQMQNTLYFKYGTQPTAAVLNTLATFIVTWWTAFLKPQQSNVCTFDNIVLRDLTVSDGAEVIGSIDGVGTRTGDPLPGNVSLVASMRTDLAGRSRRGRNYIIGITEGDVSGNQVTTAYQASIKAAYDALLPGAAVPPPGVLSVVSRVASGVPRSVALVTPVARMVVNADVDSQRRRLAGRGR